jgi:hypothetical protein
MLRRRCSKMKNDKKKKKLTVQEVKNRRKMRGKRELKKRARMQTITLQIAIFTQT